MTNRFYVDKTNGKIVRTDLYLVSIVMNDGTTYENLEPRRLFPLSNTTKYITFLDSNEKEIAIVKDMAELDDESRTALEECFKEYYLIPKITKVTWVEDKYGILTFRVMTDRGEIEFRIRNRHSDIKMFYGTDRVIIRDANDNRYEIPHYDQLDKMSKHLLFSYV